MCILCFPTLRVVFPWACPRIARKNRHLISIGLNRLVSTVFSHPAGSVYRLYLSARRGRCPRRVCELPRRCNPPAHRIPDVQRGCRRPTSRGFYSPPGFRADPSKPSKSPTFFGSVLRHVGKVSVPQIDKSLPNFLHIVRPRCRPISETVQIREVTLRVKGFHPSRRDAVGVQYAHVKRFGFRKIIDFFSTVVRVPRRGMVAGEQIVLAVFRGCSADGRYPGQRFIVIVNGSVGKPRALLR